MEDPETRIRALTEHANAVEVDAAVSPKLYFRSGVQMITTAGIYYDEGNWTAALILYMKYIVLFVERLPKHPQYKSPPGLADHKKTTKSNLTTVAFPRAEELKSKLRQKYRNEYASWKAAEDARLQREAEEQQRLQEEEQQAEIARQQRLAAIEEERQLALHKKQYELAQQHEQELQRQHQLEEERQRGLEMERQDSLRRVEAERARREEERQQALAAASLTLAESNPPSYSSVALSPTAPPISSIQSQGETTSNSLTSSTVSMGSARPTIDRSLKPLKPEVESDEGEPAGVAPNGYRWLRVPLDIPQKFLQCAAANTQRNLEFCGILCGRLQRNVFSITHVIIPKQTSTADSCTMLNEEDLFDIQDQNSLITLGWIHTHPTQTSFLSSVDLHTQFSYQVMMDEAVAIVCAPRYNQTGLYSLTTQGMRDIRQCKEKGFHPHSQQPPLFEDCAHTLVQSDLQSTFIDLRS
ncbi:STAM-binding protein-like [Sycon ciliatum]|uniref:STAM-binding protein-like n=1 Tax=Sycon ciliatum TaxID=27933 RepID=UPI0020AA7003